MTNILYSGTRNASSWAMRAWLALREQDMEFEERIIESGKKSLLPADIELRARTRPFVAWQHSELSNICPRLSFESSFYPDHRALTEAEVFDCNRLLAVLENELASNGGSYLFGELSLADLDLVPTVV